MKQSLPFSAPLLDPLDPTLDAQMFDLAPVSLWLEDYSGLRALFDRWAAEGVVDLAAFLAADTTRVTACAARIQVIKVNRRTLELFEASGFETLVGQLDRMFREDTLVTHAAELVALWNGATTFDSQTVNYTLTGRRLDVQVHGTVLPGFERSMKRVLVAVQDITEREATRRQLAVSEAHTRALFEFAPVSLWVQDFSTIRRLIEDARSKGIVDFRVFLDVHEDFIERCMREIRVLDVNRHTLEVFRAPDQDTLLKRTAEVFRDKMKGPFKELLIGLWEGRLQQHREVVNYSLTGEELHLLLHFSVLPDHLDDWSLVQVALTDITARKKAEAYLEFLGKHDELTKLFNRSFYVEELNRLERRGRYPISIIMIDLNGLKVVNDELGHLAGDAVLRRVGEVIGKAVDEPCYACRIGGDEFALLMPDTDEHAGDAMIDQLTNLIDLNNQFYSTTALRLSFGIATAQPGERLEKTIRLADERMYRAKREFYASNHDRRRPQVPGL